MWVIAYPAIPPPPKKKKSFKEPVIRQNALRNNSQGRALPAVGATRASESHRPTWGSGLEFCRAISTHNNRTSLLRLIWIRVRVSCLAIFSSCTHNFCGDLWAVEALWTTRNPKIKWFPLTAPGEVWLSWVPWYTTEMHLPTVELRFSDWTSGEEFGASKLDNTLNLTLNLTPTLPFFHRVPTRTWPIQSG